MKRDAVVFGRKKHLMGIFSEVQGSSRAVILWNTGVSSRGGPFRLNAALSEALVNEGYSVLRFDLSKLGDSSDPEENHSFQLRNSLDLKDAVDLVTDRSGIEDIILVGLCSGAMDAYYFALEDKRIKGLFMLDALVYPTPRHKLTFLALRLSSPYRWKRIAKKLLGKINYQAAELLPADYFESNYPSVAEASQGFEQLLERDVRLQLIYTGGFTPYYSYRTQFYDMLPAVPNKTRIEVDYWPEVDHLFMLLEDRRRFVAKVLAWISSLPKIDLKTSSASKEIETKPLLTAIAPVELQPEHEPEPSPGPGIPIDEVLEVFNQVLSPTRMEAEDSFFDYGGTSVLAIRLTLALGERFNIDIPVVAIYSHMTPKAMADAIQSGEFLSGPAPCVVPTQEVSHSDDDAYAIIGMSANVPGAKSVEEFWAMILEGREGITHWTKDQLDPSLPKALIDNPQYVPSRGIIDGDRFDAAFFKMSRREAEFLDPQQRVLIESSWQALDDAGLINQRSQARIAVYAAVGSNTYLTRNLAEGHFVSHSEEEYLALLLNDKDYVATRVAYALNLKGPAVSVHTACSSSLVAVIEGIKAIAAGQADIALCAAASVNAPMASGHLYQEGSIFSSDGHCRPFDEKASGTMFSDGAAAIVIKPFKKALADHDQIYAVIKGWGMNNDGADKSSFAAPSSKGQEEAIRQAIMKAKIEPSSIGYIECHGTGTPIGDPIELEALRKAYIGSSASSTMLGSSKANIGHLTAAAGGISLIKVALAVKHGIKPKLTNFTKAHPNLRADRLPFGFPLQNMPWAGARIAAVSSFGIGGTNAHIILEAAPEHILNPMVRSNLDPWTTVRVTAATQDDALRLAKAIRFDRPADGLSYTFAHKRASLPWGLATTSLNSFPTSWTKTPQLLTAKTNLIFSFPGQGSQYLRLGEDLVQSWPRFANHYRASLDHFHRVLNLDLRKVLRNKSDLHETRNTQALLYAFEWSLAKALMDAGFEPSAVLGHSLGEISAAAIASVFSFEDGAKLVFERGRLMQETPTGAMLAIRSSFEILKREIPGDWELAAENSSENVVISAGREEIDRIHEICRSRDIPSKKINDSRAFHSRYMESALPEFRKVLQGIRLTAPKIKIFSTVYGRILTDAEAVSIDYWAEQIRKPVLFKQAAEAASLIEQSSFIEVGPKDTLQKFLLQIVKRPSISLIPQRGMSETEDLTLAFSELSLQHHAPFIASKDEIISTAPYPFAGEQYWLEPKGGRKTQPSSAELTLRTTTRKGMEDLTSGSDSRLLLLAQLLGQSHERIDINASWNTLGMDSLLLTQWALKLQREYSYDVNLKRLQSDVDSMAALYRAYPLESQAIVALEENELAVWSEPLGDLGSDPTDLRAMQSLMHNQIRLMNRQLDLMQQLLGDAPRPQSKTKVFEFHTDSGLQRIEADEQAFLGLDENGGAALFIEDSNETGTFRKITS
jgi:acyl transferase domain-containing protein